jgi:predicted thioesterase
MELVGATGRTELTVSETDTAIAFGSGDVPVLATPRVLALVEAATVAAVEGRLEEGQTTVGTRVELAHTSPTPVGRTVVATAAVSSVDGRRVLFDVIVTDGSSVAAAGLVERVIVDREKFTARAYA